MSEKIIGSDVPGDFVHHSKKNEEALEEICKELGFIGMRIFGSPGSSHASQVEHALKILQDYKKEKEGGTFGVPGKSNFRILDNF